MPDNISEFKEFILRTIQREVASIDAQRAAELRPQSLAPMNPTGSAAEPGFDGAFATGYDSGSGETTVPFTVGLSVIGGTDVITFSP